MEAGVDANDNGVLDAGEITSTTYVCDGAGGTSSLVSTTAEPAGANCPFGGTKVESGIDTNKNGTLDSGEVNASATTYVCNASQTGTVYPSTGIAITYKAVSTTAGQPITVRFLLKDDRGYPVDINGNYSLNVKIQPRFALAWLTKDATTGVVSPLTVYTKSGATPMPTMYNPLGGAGQGTVVENGVGAGDYTYTFPTTTTTNGAVAVQYDATKMSTTHVVWMQVSRQTDLIYTDNANTYSSANAPKYFVPDNSTTPITRNVAAQDKCDNCHAKFKAETGASAEFHGGGRVNVSMCNVCHNPGRTSNPSANSASFIHRIHQGEEVATANLFHGIAATYPRDTRDCATCHGGASEDQSLSNPSQLACNGCHDYVKYEADPPSVPYCNVNGNLTRGSDGKPLPCNHIAGAQSDSSCVGCHGANQTFATTRYHKPVAPPDPNNIWKTGGTNANTNASFVAAGGYVPPGADVITYDIQKVDTVADAVDATIKHPRMYFKFKKNGTDVTFNTYSLTAPEMIDNFTGSPSAYFAFAVPQDNINAPADFNASVSGYLKNIWKGTATGTGAGTLTGPDAANSNYYTLVLTGVRIPAEATMLTGGLGYTYSLSSAPPFVQTNLADYPVTTDSGTLKTQGGLSVPAPNVWKVATGYTGRRAIVDNAKCKNCHGTLGVEPSFHAGQRNDGPTCSFCHTPNRNSSGWQAGSKYFIHAIHAGRKRVVPYTWHAASAGPGYDEVEFPGTLNTCTTCHATGAYDFTNASSFSALANTTFVTAASGVVNDTSTNSTYYTISPYVAQNVSTDYGATFAYNASPTATNNGYTAAADSNLVNSPITNVCASCHDTSIAITHMQQNGGQFYAVRSTAVAAPKEQCIICHGPGRIAAIGSVHQR